MGRVLRLARRVVAYEWGMWRSLTRWVLRRPYPVAPGAETYAYVGGVQAILLAFIVLSTIEIPVLDVILRHTVDQPTVRHAAIGLGVWGVLWMVGLLASLRIHPHVVDDAGLRVRNGVSIDVTIPWTAVAEVSFRRRSLPSSRAVQYDADDPAVLNLGVGSQTAIDVVLREPLSVPLPKGPSAPVREIRLYADDPGALVERARRHLPATDPVTRRPTR
ncbi:PH domain-containing protein [Micromonospora sp. WMMA1998]|uniref:PH domain-containing protein n=1 Tax=Micromonospora sp. WMMA1998 TaxID=3015167 RepID=UPI00248BAD6D|nr:PH domain-containing protein [Micromonospora sp. WMMA1998]WBC13838.1 PH domain-containing protein [Micromonospora sp. WMMA1998]